VWVLVAWDSILRPCDIKKSIYMDHKKVEAVLKWERPMNVTEIHSFMKLAGIIGGL
jgi:hypothetical protein